MADIELSEIDKKNATVKIQRYFARELDQNIGGFDAQFLLEFFAKEFGAIYYNQGLYDAQAAFKDKLDALADTVLDLEKPIQSG